MKTKQFISTICYSSADYTKLKLDSLLSCGKIDFYCFIFHKKEEDEKKDHLHLFIMPSAPIDTKEIDMLLIQPCEDGQSLGTCGIWHTVGKNNVSDFLLYVMHDKMYMRIKGYTERKYEYYEDDFVTSHLDGLSNLIYDAYHNSMFTFNRRVMDMIIKSKDITQTGKDMVLNGYIPLNSTCSFHHLLQIIKEG